MTAGGEAQNGDAVGIGVVFFRVGAHISNRRSSILLRLGEQLFGLLLTVPDDVGVKAVHQKTQGDGFGLTLTAEVISAAGTDDDGRTNGVGNHFFGYKGNIDIHGEFRAVGRGDHDAFVCHRKMPPLFVHGIAQETRGQRCPLFTFGLNGSRHGVA